MMSHWKTLLPISKYRLSTGSDVTLENVTSGLKMGSNIYQPEVTSYVNNVTVPFEVATSGLRSFCFQSDATSYGKTSLPVRSRHFGIVSGPTFFQPRRNLPGPALRAFARATIQSRSINHGYLGFCNIHRATLRANSC